LLSLNFGGMTGEKIVLDNILVEQNKIESTFLKRTVRADVYLPANVHHPENMSLLLINDGQDLPKMLFEEILDTLILENIIEPLVCVGIHCGPERKMEYGAANQPDYKGRGAKARKYTKFVFEELLPFLNIAYSAESFKEKSFAGFSLGGVSALDIVWNHPEEFIKVGVFSGSLWWRSKGYREGYNNATDRIMHRQIKKGVYHPGLKFFFECGAWDETADRNNNGVIDSIDDTIDLITELKQKGYSDADIEYLELADGRHDVATWGRAFPYFLQWGWGK
jgi:esterase/lipase superfamily enzyme